jgi:hypothetical protein
MITTGTHLRVRVRTALGIVAVASFGACTNDATAPLVRTPRVALHDVTPTIVVTNTNDDGAGSLRQAIANAAAGDVIGFGASIAGKTIVLTTGLLEISKSLTIQGPTPGGITISGGGVSRVLIVTAPSSTDQVVLRNLTITGGKVSGLGAGIYQEFGSSLTIDHTLITGNTADEGGGVYNVQGVLTVINSTISGNTVRPSIGQNAAGGAIANFGTLTVTSSTIDHNVGNAGGTVTAAGIFSQGVNPATYRNTIIAQNTSTDASGAHTDNCRNGSGPAPALVGVNLSDDGSCGAAGAHMIVADPQLGALADNGGPTFTRALAKTSPAVEAVPLGDCTVSDDQRYVARPQGAACDVGAFEFNSFVQTPLSIDGSAAVNPSTGVATVSGTISCPESISLTIHVALSEAQKAGRVNTTVSAADDVTLTCNGKKAWSIALTPAVGAFQTGTGTVKASTTNRPVYVTAASASGSVKMFWGHQP